MTTKIPKGPHCRYCCRPRPPGYSVTCGQSPCQQEDYEDSTRHLKRRRHKKRGG